MFGPRLESRAGWLWTHFSEACIKLCLRSCILCSSKVWLVLESIWKSFFRSLVGRKKPSVVKTFPCEQTKLGFIIGILWSILVTMFLYEDLEFAKPGFIFVQYTTYSLVPMIVDICLTCSWASVFDSGRSVLQQGRPGPWAAAVGWPLTPCFLPRIYRSGSHHIEPDNVSHPDTYYRQSNRRLCWGPITSGPVVKGWFPVIAVGLQSTTFKF